MKKVLKTCLPILAVVLLSMSIPALAADIKIGIVDFQKVLEESTAGKAAQEQINKEGDKMEADLKAKGDEIEKIKEDFEREALVMSADKRDEKEREIRIKINDLKSLQKRYMMEFKEKEKDLVRGIQREVTRVVEDIGKREGYTLILERRESGSVYFPEAIDITDKVIKAYDKRS